jgi:hypothetical protein
MRFHFCGFLAHLVIIRNVVLVFGQNLFRSPLGRIVHRNESPRAIAERRCLQPSYTDTATFPTHSDEWRRFAGSRTAVPDRVYVTPYPDTAIPSFYPQ